MEAGQAHNLEVGGSSPSPATQINGLYDNQKGESRMYAINFKTEQEHMEMVAALMMEHHERGLLAMRFIKDIDGRGKISERE